MSAVMLKKSIEGAVGTLSNTMRLYNEAQMGFGYLLSVDREEAINNLDRAFEAKLEAFHALYDVSKSIFPYFDNGDTALLIAIRNAVHHRDHPLFRSFYARLFLDNDPSRYLGASFLLASYPTLDGTPVRMNHYIRLDDLEARLDPKLGSPHFDPMSKLNKAEQRFSLIEQHLALAAIRRKGMSERYPDDQIYIDLMPVFISAICRVFDFLYKMDFSFKEYDSEVYMKHFTSGIGIDFNNPIFEISHISG